MADHRGLPSPVSAKVQFGPTREPPPKSLLEPWRSPGHGIRRVTGRLRLIYSICFPPRVRPRYQCQYTVGSPKKVSPTAHAAEWRRCTPRPWRMCGFQTLRRLSSRSSLSCIACRLLSVFFSAEVHTFRSSRSASAQGASSALLRTCSQLGVALLATEKALRETQPWNLATARGTRADGMSKQRAAVQICVAHACARRRRPSGP